MLGPLCRLARYADSRATGPGTSRVAVDVVGITRAGPVDAGAFVECMTLSSHSARTREAAICAWPVPVGLIARRVAEELRAGGRSRGRCRWGSRGGGGPERAGRLARVARSCGGNPRAVPRSRIQRGGAPAHGVSSGEVDRHALDVPATDRGLTALISVGGDHLAGSVEQHLAGLLHRAPTGHDGRPLGKLGHRPAVLIGREDRGQGQRMVHPLNGTAPPRRSPHRGVVDLRREGEHADTPAGRRGGPRERAATGGRAGRPRPSLTCARPRSG